MDPVVGMRIATQTHVAIDRLAVPDETGLYPGLLVPLLASRDPVEVTRSPPQQPRCYAAAKCISRPYAPAGILKAGCPLRCKCSILTPRRSISLKQAARSTALPGPHHRSEELTCKQPTCRNRPYKTSNATRPPWNGGRSGCPSHKDGRSSE